MAHYHPSPRYPKWLNWTAKGPGNDDWMTWQTTAQAFGDGQNPSTIWDTSEDPQANKGKAAAPTIGADGAAKEQHAKGWKPKIFNPSYLQVAMKAKGRKDEIVGSTQYARKDGGKYHHDIRVQGREDGGKKYPP